MVPYRDFHPMNQHIGILCELHAAFSLPADFPVCFVHAHSPWECGADENTNGLIREYLPKGAEIPTDIDYLWPTLLMTAARYTRIQETKRSVHGANASGNRDPTGLNCSDRLRPP